MNDYFRTLELEPNCTLDDIKQAYRRLAKLYHPDVSKLPNAHQKFIEITEAYEVLLHEYTIKSDVEQQTQYDYEAFIREVREAAQKQARMRYEKFVRENEAFRESGLYDLSLLLKYVGRVVVPLLGAGLISIPVAVSFSEHSVAPVFYLFFCWVIGGIILFDAYQKRKGYFKLGRFYYSGQKILQFYTARNNQAVEKCFYCNGLKADSLPYKINFIKIKDVQLKNFGPMQHYAGYNRNEFSYAIPRSHKAFIVHSITSVIKVLSIVLAMILAPFDSFIWRFVAGLLFGWLLASLVLWVSRTKSKTGYLFSYAVIIKVIVWTFVLAMFTKFQASPLQIVSGEYMKLCLVIMAFGDSLLEQLLKVSKKHYLFKPILKQYRSMDAYFGGKYILYLEVPLWTTVYPIIRWIF